jgi:hypothetical protein
MSTVKRTRADELTKCNVAIVEVMVESDLFMLQVEAVMLVVEDFLILRSGSETGAVLCFVGIETTLSCADRAQACTVWVQLRLDVWQSDKSRSSASSQFAPGDDGADRSSCPVRSM